MPAGSQSPHCTRMVLVLVSMRGPVPLPGGDLGARPMPEAYLRHDGHDVAGRYGARNWRHSRGGGNLIHRAAMVREQHQAASGFSTRIATPCPPPAQAVAMP